MTQIKSQITIVGFWRNTHAQTLLRDWAATRLAEPMIDGDGLFDFSRTAPVAGRLAELAELAKANHARLAAS